MKKQIKMLFVFLMVWAPLGAQTFEKTIKTATHDQLYSMMVDKNNNITMFVMSTNYQALPNYYLEVKPTFTRVIQLDKNGNQRKQKIITSNRFIPSLDSSIATLYSYAGMYQNNNYLVNGTARIDTPTTYANILYVLDSNLSVINCQIQDTLVDKQDYIF